MNNDLLKVRLIRGICLRQKGNVAYKAGTQLTISSATKDPNEQELLRLAEPGVLHMGRNVAEFVLDGPALEFTSAELEVIRMAPRSAYPEIAKNLAAKMECSVDHTAALLARALNIHKSAFLPYSELRDPVQESSEAPFEREPVVESIQETEPALEAPAPPVEPPADKPKRGGK